MAAERFEVGAPVLHGGKRYVMRGFSRLSLDSTQFMSLEDAVTGERVTVPADEVSLPGAPRDMQPGTVVPLRPDL